MQVSEKEREVLLNNVRKELVNIVSSRVVHPVTNRLFPPNIIEEAIQKLGFDVKMADSAKKQANYLIKELSQRYFIKKADMEIKVTIREEWISSCEDTEAIQPTVKKVLLEGEEGEEDTTNKAAIKSKVEQKAPKSDKIDSETDVSQINTKTNSNLGGETSESLKAKHERFVQFLKSNSVSMKVVQEGKLISYVCIIEAAKYKEISVETKLMYSKSICEITEYMLVNKNVRSKLPRKRTSMTQTSLR